MVSPPLFRQSLSVGGDSCCAAVAVVLPTTCPFPRDTQPPWLLPLSHRHNHLATVSVAVERTGILGLAPLSRSPLRPWLVGSHLRDNLLAITRRGSLLRHSSKGFRVGHTWVSAPALLAGCCLYFHTACPAPCRLVGGWCYERPDVALFIVASEWTITNFESDFFFYTAKLRLGSICKVMRCFSRNLHPCG